MGLILRISVFYLEIFDIAQQKVAKVFYTTEDTR